LNTKVFPFAGCLKAVQKKQTLPEKCLENLCGEVEK